MERTNLSLTIIGCGWLGLALAETLVKKGHTVFGTVRSESGFNALREVGVKPIKLDVEKSTSLPEIVLNSTEILVITLPPIDRKNPNHYKRILEELLGRFSEDVRVIFTSSTGIYPEDASIYDENFVFTQEQESTVLNVAENVIRASKKQSVIFRLGGLTGPNRHPIRFLEGRIGVKNPDGPINFVQQGDCLQALLLTIENTAISGTFNLVYPEHPTRKNYYSAAAKHYALNPPEFVKEAAIERLISSDKIVSELSFAFKFPINDFPKLNLD
jgi:nucleoside-diphosphate-sugar epimerase